VSCNSKNVLTGVLGPLCSLHGTHPASYPVCIGKWSWPLTSS